MVKYAGRLIMVGIPPDDKFAFGHSLARRKGLTIRLARRMKHTYPRAIQLVSGNPPPVPIDELVTHRFPLEQTAAAFQKASSYANGLMKAMVAVGA
jgi:L-iditol 2-dehydrogenase